MTTSNDNVPAVNLFPNQQAEGDTPPDGSSQSSEVPPTAATIDPETTGILLQVSLAAHEYAKAKTGYLSSLLDDKEPRVEVPLSIAGKRETREAFRPSDWRAAYTSRLYTRQSAQRAYVPAFAKDYARIVHSASFRRLQGKSQLIPAGENYFFRTRLTHSLEVSEIATRIARKINCEHAYFREHPLDCDLIACAALLHDIGHPPFGHSGEEALNEKMEKDAGFEGNAQTLRLVTRLENRLGRGGAVQEVYDEPRGLNLTVGTLAAIIKYDRIYDGPRRDTNGNLLVTKGYYPDEADIVREIKARLGMGEDRALYTIECQIMDIADDIAYSAYDLEDTMEAGIVTPFDFISVEDETLVQIRDYVAAQFAKRKFSHDIQPSDVLRELAKVFATILIYADRDQYDMREWAHRTVFVGRSHNESLLHARNPLLRRQFLETLIEGNIDAITVELDPEMPFLSKLKVDPERLITIECMKAFNFHKVVASRKLQIPRYRGKHVISGLFDIFAEDEQGLLMSDQARIRLAKCEGNHEKRMRLISDIIAGMTDGEAGRLFNQLNGGRDSSVFDYT